MKIRLEKTKPALNKRLALTALWAVRVPQNASRAYALCGILLHHIFAVAGNLRFPLSQPQKRQLPRTLGEIPIDIIKNNFYNNDWRIYEKMHFSINSDDNC